MQAFADLVTRHHGEILDAWLEDACHAASARGLPRPELANIMPVYLRELAATRPRSWGRSPAGAAR